MFFSDFMEPQKNPRWPPKSHIFAISQYFVDQTYKCDTSLIIFFQGEPIYALKTVNLEDLRKYRSFYCCLFNVNLLKLKFQIFQRPQTTETLHLPIRTLFSALIINICPRSKAQAMIYTILS